MGREQEAKARIFYLGAYAALKRRSYTGRFCRGKGEQSGTANGKVGS